jgi:hypothetical protein
MNKRDPKLTALQFNEYINNQDIKGLSSLMAEVFSEFKDKNIRYNFDIILIYEILRFV